MPSSRRAQLGDALRVRGGDRERRQHRPGPVREQQHRVRQRPRDDRAAWCRPAAGPGSAGAPRPSAAPPGWSPAPAAPAAPAAVPRPARRRPAPGARSRPAPAAAGCPASRSVSTSSGGRAVPSVSRSASSTACPSSRPSCTGAVSTSQVPSGNAPAARAAARRASRNLPTPPGPVTVTSRRAASSRASSVSSCCRPTKLVTSAGSRPGSRPVRPWCGIPIQPLLPVSRPGPGGPGRPARPHGWRPARQNEVTGG